MFRLFRLLVVALLAAPVVSFAQEAEKKPAAPVSTDMATVYFYRYKQFVGGGLEPSVYCDEVQLARMDNGRFFAIKLAPGRHAFRSNDKQSGVELELKGGQAYYLRVDIVTGFMKGHGRLTAVAAEQGEYEVKKLQPLGADKVKDKRVSIEPIPGATPK
jgi:hypothetical protein